jgi:hypothetical protein
MSESQPTIIQPSPSIVPKHHNYGDAQRPRDVIDPDDATCDPGVSGIIAEHGDLKEQHHIGEGR